MDRWCFMTALMVLFLVLMKVSSETVEVRQALVDFMDNLFPGNAGRDVNWGWNNNSDPCVAKWKGVDCVGSPSVKKIVLDGLNLRGILDARPLCSTKNLVVISLKDNKVAGNLPEEISNCKHLAHLLLSGNNFTGRLPDSLARLNNLKRVDISNNDFSGELPDLSRISGLVTLRAQYNQLDGKIPDFDFSNLRDFNVSYNNFSGPIPDVNGHLNASSFLGNLELCGQPLSNACPPPSTQEGKKKHSSTKQYLIYSGYAILGLIIVLLVLYKVFKKKKDNGSEKSSSPDASVSSKLTATSDLKVGESRSEFSLTSRDNNGKTASLVILSSPVVNGLRFEDLLRAPAELVGRGKHGTLYKVTLNNLGTVAVKRIKDWELSGDQFKKRMQRINRVRHPNVLPAIAYYCSQQEKLLVYEFQQNGCLSKYLNGSQNGEVLDWGSRLNIAVKIANALAFMHKELQNDGISHGNLKSSNILLNMDMEPCISEYGLMVVENNEDQHQLISERENTQDRNPSREKKKLFKADVYSLGIILLELLTGKLVQNRASELTRWVRAVVTEEWTAEVFDKALTSEGASEERMVNLLQVALKCIIPSQDARPTSTQVAAMINSIKEDEDKSTYTSSEL